MKCLDSSQMLMNFFFFFFAIASSNCSQWFLPHIFFLLCVCVCDLYSFIFVVTKSYN